MKFKNIFFTIALLLVFMYACDSTNKKSEALVDQQNEAPNELKESIVEKIQFEKLVTATNPDAMLDIYNPIGNEDFKEGKVAFSFNIRNHGLGRENPLMLSLNGASPKPYTLPNFQMDLNKGTYRAVAFLVNEEGLALKEYGNFSQRDFTVGGSRPFPEDEEPYVILHLPIEQQSYAADEQVVVDFLYLGGAPDSDGVKVLIEIDGQQFITEEIVPVKLSKIEKGTHSLKVSLIKAGNGEELSGVFSSQTRNILIE
tara:strand:+ start:3204 stop:3971 length:768 start_codon:yes stop_codon:yes gene_type:complete